MIGFCVGKTTTTHKAVFHNLPAMLPRAQTACSHTLAWSDSSSLMNFGTAPAFTTALV